jgi:hypothetical protein
VSEPVNHGAIPGLSDGAMGSRHPFVVAAQAPERDVRITLPAQRNSKLYLLPFLGEVQEVRGGWRDGRITCVIPEIQKAMAVWCD